MNREYIIADSHFGDKKIFEMRGFKSLTQMETRMIYNWNSIVNNQDIVYINGDFCLGSRYKTESMLKRLNGKKVMVMGNHDFAIGDTKWWIETKQFIYVSPNPILIHHNILISHEPISDFHTFTGKDEFINLYGHVHTNPKYKDNKFSACTSAERLDYKPIEIKELLKKIKTL